MSTKICATCKTERSLEEFFKRIGTYDGLMARCKACHRAHLDDPVRTTKRRELGQRYLRRPEIRIQTQTNHRIWVEQNFAQHLILQSRARAKQRGLPHTITRTDISIPARCPLLDIELKRAKNGKPNHGSPTLDRLIPARGYVPKNVWVISWRANALKNNGSLFELEAIARGFDAKPLVLHVADFDMRLPLNESRYRARKNGIAHSISASDILVPTHCPLLGIPLIRNPQRTSDGSATIDRIDPLLGYVPGNVRVISYKANRIKSNATADELRMLAVNLRRALDERYIEAIDFSR